MNDSRSFITSRLAVEHATSTYGGLKGEKPVRGDNASWGQQVGEAKRRATTGSASGWGSPCSIARAHQAVAAWKALEYGVSAAFESAGRAASRQPGSTPAASVGTGYVRTSRASHAGGAALYHTILLVDYGITHLGT